MEIPVNNIEKITRSKPTDAEKISEIKQPEHIIYELEKTNECFMVDDTKIYLYKSPTLSDFYIPINDYCAAIGVKPDGGNFMHYMQFPEIVLAYRDFEDKKIRVFFINVHGCKTMISNTRYRKYHALKEKIYCSFLNFLTISSEVKKETEYDNSENIQEFKMFDDTPVLFNEELNSDSSDNEEQIENTADIDTDSLFIKTESEIGAAKIIIKELLQEIKDLKKENDDLKKKKCYTVNEDKINRLKTFITQCEISVDPFTNKYILDTLTEILTKAIQIHIGNGADKSCFIKDFNLHTGRDTMYKDQVKEYSNEPFVRIAMRLYGYDVLKFGLNSPVYRDSILYQFRNMFEINITNNKCILGIILGLLKRNVEPQVGDNRQLTTKITFEIQEI